MPVGSALCFAIAQLPRLSPARTAAKAFLLGVPDSLPPVQPTLNLVRQLFCPSQHRNQTTSLFEGDRISQTVHEVQPQLLSPALERHWPPRPHIPGPFFISPTPFSQDSLLWPKGSIPCSTDIPGASTSASAPLVFHLYRTAFFCPLSFLSSEI